ncbi:iron-sulfur cluster insertion protein ErpA [Halovulum sp. GXIMD14793]
MDLSLPPKVTDRAYAQLARIAEDAGAVKHLRVAVEGGGCSGFQYELTLEDTPAEDDLVLQRDGQAVLIDPVSLPFLTNAEIDFTEELIGARFVVNNPNATSSCGCGTSFSI